MINHVIQTNLPFSQFIVVGVEMTQILLGNCQNNHQCFSGPVGPAQMGWVCRAL